MKKNVMTNFFLIKLGIFFTANKHLYLPEKKICNIETDFYFLSGNDH